MRLSLGSHGESLLAALYLLLGSQRFCRCGSAFLDAFRAIGPLLPFLLTAGYSLTMLYLFGKKVSDWPSREDITSICQLLHLLGVGSTIYVLTSVFLPETTGSEFPKTIACSALWAECFWSGHHHTHNGGYSTEFCWDTKQKNEEVTSFRDYPFASG